MVKIRKIYKLCKKCMALTEGKTIGEANTSKMCKECTEEYNSAMICFAKFGEVCLRQK